MLHCLALMGTVEVFTLIFEFNQVVGEKDAEKTLTSIFNWCFPIYLFSTLNKWLATFITQWQLAGNDIMQYLLYGSKKFHVLFTCSSVTLLKIVYQRKEMTYEQTAMVKEIITCEVSYWQ